jgi:hypothetical protein
MTIVAPSIKPKYWAQSAYGQYPMEGASHNRWGHWIEVRDLNLTTFDKTVGCSDCFPLDEWIVFEFDGTRLCAEPLGSTKNHMFVAASDRYHLSSEPCEPHPQSLFNQVKFLFSQLFDKNTVVLKEKRCTW